MSVTKTKCQQSTSSLRRNDIGVLGRDQFVGSNLESDRRIKRLRCDSCEGAGQLGTPLQAKCGACGGRGWVELSSGGEIICSECSGDGHTTQQSFETCDTCGGRGYHVRIVEDQLINRDCPVCVGDGGIQVDKICTLCEGLGTVDLDASEEIEGGGDRESRDVYCRTCRGTGADIDDTGTSLICADCRGRGSIVVTVPAGDSSDFDGSDAECPRCGGYGSIAKRKSCKKCSGSGKIEEVVETDITPDSNR